MHYERIFSYSSASITYRQKFFFQAYSNGEEPADSAWVLDWAEWAATYELLEERLSQYRSGVKRLLMDAQVDSLSQLMERTARHEPVAVPA